MGITLQHLDGHYAVAQLPSDAAIPDWWQGPGFTALARGDDELSLVCRQERVPQAVRADYNWLCLKFLGPFAFNETGIVLSVIRPLSENGIGIFVTSTFNGDYLLIKAADWDHALPLLTAAGHKAV